MLHIILLILKIIGIILLVILGLLLLMLLSVLFVPIGYRLRASKKEAEWKSAWVQGDVTWLFHLIKFRAEFVNGTTRIKIYFLGIPLNFLTNKYKRTPSKESDLEESTEQGKEPKTEVKSEVNSEAESEPNIGLMSKAKLEVVPELKTEEKSEAKSESGVEAKRAAQSESKSKKKRKEKSTEKKGFSRILELFKNIKNKKDHIFEIIKGDEFKAAFGLCKSEVFRILRHIRPKRWEGSLYFGMSSPDQTGYILGIIALMMPLYRDHLQVIPDFEQPRLEGKILIKGHMQVFTFLVTAFRLYRDQNIKRVIALFSNENK